MAVIVGQGNFINGSFLVEGTITLTSKNPSCNYEPVFSVKTDAAHINLAVAAAKKAHQSWTYQNIDQRINALLSFKDALQKNEDLMADAIATEMGKIKSEALTESKSLSARIDLMINHGLKRVATENFYDLRAQTRYHNQGALLVIGPYNFPAHLVNAHVIPSVLLGNCVVIKPSEVCPKVAEIYAQCVMQSSIPPGVINVVHGDGAMGKALAFHPDIDGVLFTGSYRTGRLLKEALLDQPHKILALEMGGKNFSIVMDDADLYQATLEIIQAAFLTTGQRCTATSRVLVHDRIFDRFRTMLINATRLLKPCSAFDQGMFGPMATKNALDHFLSGLKTAKAEGAEVLVESELLPGGAYVTPSLYQVSARHPLHEYLGEELFGPHISLENFSSLDHAIARVNESPYGLSNAIFTHDVKNSERMIHETKSGVLNINRSTNNAFGQMPFGGVNKSGNQRAAGIDAVRYVTFPMAITSMAYGDTSASKDMRKLFSNFADEKTDISLLARKHEIEAAFEIYGIYSDSASTDRLIFNTQTFDGLAFGPAKLFDQLQKVFGKAMIIDNDRFVISVSLLDDVNVISNLEDCLAAHANANGLSLKKTIPLTMNVPKDLAMPRSRSMLDRLYRRHFVPMEKKSPVADLRRSRGPFLVSVDDDPLILFDAASQIATLGAGFMANAFQNAYDNNELDLALVCNYDLSLSSLDDQFAADAEKSRFALEGFLHKKTDYRFASIAFTAAGAEANEVAFDQARLNGPGGTRILSFEGSFHGRTIMALQATYNKEKRGPFLFEGFQATFLPFPELKTPNYEQPAIPTHFLDVLTRGDIPYLPNGDQLLQEELAIFSQLKDEINKGNICAVIVELMQCEGGDRYASDRFFCGLRALTRGMKIPLIFDEVQTGFHLGRDFFWYQQINLVDQHGQREHPDCVTLAKKAQLGVCMSVWKNPRVYAPHVIQLKRGLLHAQTLEQDRAIHVEKTALKELTRLQEYFPELVLYPRARGFAFAFDMPTKDVAMQLIDQRFHRGFMAYIAGEKTLRFRLNMVTSDEHIRRLFEKLMLAIVDIRDQQTSEKIAAIKKVTSPAKPNVRFLQLNLDNFAEYLPAIDRIEQQSYEPGRRDSMDGLRYWLTFKDGLGLVMMGTYDQEEIVLGYAFGGPLEQANVDGALDDPHRSQRDTFYSANITVDDRARGLGLGSLLKHEQIKHVTAMLNADDSPRYSYLSGRNRVGMTSAMTQINDNLFAYAVSLHEHQYGERGATASYYRLPLRLAHHNINSPAATILDCQNSVQTVFKSPPKNLINAVQKNHLRTIVGSKLTLSNWATPQMVRYSELLRALMPKNLSHAYFTSGRDEVLDKGLRCLRCHRPKGEVAIGFSHQWLGVNTAAARSLSHDENQALPFSFFGWPKIAHPQIVGTKASLKELNTHLTNPDRILGLVIELVGERSAFCFDEAFLHELDAIRQSTGIPLVFVENASAFNRTGRSLFLSDHLPVKPNMVLWYTGGQLGHVLVDDQYFADKPLTLISTWDGDEISMARAYHHLLFAHEHADDKNVHSFENAVSTLGNQSQRRGIGLWQAFSMPNADALKRALQIGREHGVVFGQGFDCSLMVCPKPDFNREDFTRVIEVLKQIL